MAPHRRHVLADRKQSLRLALRRDLSIFISGVGELQPRRAIERSGGALVAVRDCWSDSDVAESLPLLGTVKAAPVGAEGGVGFEVRMLQHTFFAEARYMTISPGGVLPVTVGIRF